MKLVSSVVAAAILNAIVPDAQAATTDPLKTIYRVSGLKDSGSAANTGVATSSHCTNFSTETEELRFVIRDENGVLIEQSGLEIPSRWSVFVETHRTALFSGEELSPGVTIPAGFAIIRATSMQFHCSAMIVDAAATVPQGIALHMVRFDPLAGTQE